MKTILHSITIFLFLLAPAIAQETGDDGSDSALGVRQQRVKRLMLDLERKFSELAAKLEAEQPEQAQKLTEAFQRSKELLMQQRMDEVTKLLNRQKLETASEEQAKIVGDIKGLIEILLEEEDELEKMKQKIKELEEWKQKLQDLIEKEEELKEDSATIADKEGALDKLDAQIKEAEDLVRQQQALQEKTKQEATKGLDKVEQLANEQAELRERTEKLAENLSGEDSQQADGQDADPEEEQESKAPGAESMKRAAEDQERAEDRLAALEPEQVLLVAPRGVDRPARVASRHP